MKNAIISGAFLALLLAYIGVFVVLKRMSFFGDGIAHASLAGVAAAILFRGDPIVGGVLAALFFAFVIFIMEEKMKTSGDAAIGIIFSFGMALGILFLGLVPGYKTELISFLFGNILAISSSGVWLSVTAAIVFTAILFILRRQLGLLSLSEDLAKAEGINAKMIKLVLYLIIAVSVVLGIKILGIILVSAAMIIPASCAKLSAKSFAMMGILSIVFSEVFMLGGIAGSYFLNIPTGSFIVIIGASAFFVLQGINYLFKGPKKAIRR
ncbi:MAG: metal ABC transporter permease [Candidatus Colwellbacteria bacterium]|nr:metal ABC transporter permease [Candidatus Colwellbacteria bacterium]MCK9497398.1 metal ABC transporter permease [Candidatus Colwellbacteria bacterium]MDD3752563.1 metal ABC transporter permease [Candidatus Colwellbacteria bacterium]MDD4818637.1 metal ABC transporter permease [Candidatus Colwellbacteria bacterium]